MYLESIELNNFRNYENQKINFIDGINLFIGNNAQGKTNIIESIYLSCFGTSYRTLKDSECIMFEKDYLKLKLNYFKNYKSNLDLFIDKKIKLIKKDSIKINKISDLVGELLVIMFSPEDLEIVKGSPSKRRKFLNSLCSLISKSYLINLQEYNKCLKLKNSYLKNNSDTQYLEVLHEKMSKNIVNIVKFRKEVIEKLLVFVKKINSEITKETEDINIIYESKFLNLNYKEVNEILNNNIKLDLIRKTSTKGIQKDDIIININNFDVSKYGSQGQKRTSLLCLKIASFELLKNLRNETPILLLDDIMSELDSYRVEYILKYIKDYQSIITTTDINFNIDKLNINVHEVKNGNLKKIK